MNPYIHSFSNKSHIYYRIDWGLWNTTAPKLNPALAVFYLKFSFDQCLHLRETLLENVVTQYGIDKSRYYDIVHLPG
jgi:hypothetical protein